MKDEPFELRRYLENSHPDIHSQPMMPKELVFEESVRMSCFYCGRYNNNWRCPPRIPDLDYSKMMQEYEKGLFVWVNCPFHSDNYQTVRTESSIMLHRALLELEGRLWEMGAVLALSFIGGSCKLCKNGCGKERCNNPYLSRTPLEGIGVNVIKSADKYNIKIKFPPNDSIMRIGLIVWQ